MLPYIWTGAILRGVYCIQSLWISGNLCSFDTNESDANMFTLNTANSRAYTSAGLELFFVDPPLGSDAWGAPSAFFAFREQATREAVLEALTRTPALGSALPGGASIAAACASILQVSPPPIGFVIGQE